MNYIEELSRIKILDDLSNYYDIDFSNYTDDELNIFFSEHINKYKQEIKMVDFYNLSDKNILIESLDGFVKVGEKIKKENLECYTLTLVDGRKLSGAFNHLVETDKGWVKLEDLSSSHFVLTIDGFIKVKNTRKIKTQDVYDLECLHVNHRYLSNGISNHNTGKSIFAVMFMDWYRNNYDPGASFDVLTNSKLLQEQYTREFSFMDSLWGKDNYMCRNFDCTCSVGKEMAAAMKRPCGECPYDIAKSNFFNGAVSLTNFHLFLTYRVLNPNGWKRSARVLIVDEAHSFDDVASDFFATKLSRAVLMRLGVTRDEAVRVLEPMTSITDADQYRTFVEETLISFMSSHLSRMNAVAKASNSAKDIELCHTISQAIGKWERFLTEFESDKGNWTFEVNEVRDFSKDGRKRAQGETETELEVQPVWVAKYLEKYVWSKYDHIILMSGTILNRTLFADINGIKADTSTYISIQSPFPAKNRPIYYIPLGKMSYAKKHSTFLNQVPYLQKIMDKHAGVKGIIHTANYELAKWIDERLDTKYKRRLLMPNASNKMEILDMHTAESNTVLVSPSMTTGIDLKDDLSRFQVIMKVPYPSLGSQKIKKRMDSMPAWYGWMTMTTLIQSYGRSVRSMTDSADTYIMDECFGDVMQKTGYLMPKYFQEAIIKVNV